MSSLLPRDLPASLRKPLGTRSNQMAKSQQRNKINKIQDNMAPLESSYPIANIPGYPNTTKTQENDLKTIFIKMIGAFKW